MKAPNLIHAEDLRYDYEWPSVEINTDKYVSSTSSKLSRLKRPKSKSNIFDRIYLAYGVLIGKYDALKWDSQ